MVLLRFDSVKSVNVFRFEQDIFPDKASERKILDYEVKCPNENDGCQWIGELRNVEVHTKTVFDSLKQQEITRRIFS